MTAASCPRQGSQISVEPWQHDLHAALVQFAGQTGEIADHGLGELLQQAWGNEDTFLARTLLPLPLSLPLAPTNVEPGVIDSVDESQDGALDHTLRSPPSSTSDSTNTSGISLAHTLLSPERSSGRDHRIPQKRWCQHVTIAEEDRVTRAPHRTTTPSG